MRNKATFLILLLFGCSWHLNAQVKIISVKDSITNQPLVRVTVEFWGHNVPGIRTMGFTDSHGFITITKPLSPTLAKATFEGYKEKTVPYESTNDTLLILLVKVSREIELPEVSVTGYRQMVKQTPKGSILDLTKIREANFWQLSDALKQIPGVEIDLATNVVTYQGKPVALQENGMLPREVRLETSANQYTSVELVLYDPKSKFDGAILNLVKAKKEEPYWGTIQVWGGIVNQGIRPVLGFHHGVQSLEVSGTFGNSSMPSTTRKGNMQIFQTNYYSENSGRTKHISRSVFPAPTLRYTLDYKKHLVDVMFSYIKQKTKYNSSSNNKEFENEILINDYSQELDRNAIVVNKTLEIGYLFTINKNSKLNAKLSIVQPETNTDERLDVQGSDSQNPISPYQKSRIEKSTEYFSTVSYEYQNSYIGALEGGVKHFNRRLDKELAYTPFLTDGTEDLTQSASYINKYQYTAAFASWAKQIKAFSFFLVLKQDYSVDRIPTSDNQKFTYSSFSPYLSIQQRIGRHGLGLILRYDEKRPYLMQLDPVVEPGNENGRLILKGNSELETSKVYSSTFNYSTVLLKKLETNLSVNYEYTKDPITTYRTLVDNTNIMEMTFVNLGKNQRIYSNVSFRYPLTKRWGASLISSLDWNKSDLGADGSKEYHSLNVGIRSEYTFNKWQFMASGSYLKESSLQYSTSGSWMYDFYVRYSALPRWNLSLGVSTPLPYYRWSNSIIYADGYQSHSESKMRQFNVNATVVYQFGKQKTKKSTKGIVVDDM